MSIQDENENFDDAEDPNHPQLTELVAYLDGELGDAECNRVELQLATDPPLRQYAETLDRTWQLLDSLEDATASGEFTRKTLSSLQTLTTDDEAPDQKSIQEKILRIARVPLLQIGLWAIAGFLGCSAGLLLSRIVRPAKVNSADTQILRQLDLLLEYQKIRPVPSAEFLIQAASAEHRPSEQEKAP
jgi:anti-sigma factor RsiW